MLLVWLIERKNSTQMSHNDSSFLERLLCSGLKWAMITVSVWEEELSYHLCVPHDLGHLFNWRKGGVIAIRYRGEIMFLTSERNQVFTKILSFLSPTLSFLLLSR